MPQAEARCRDEGPSCQGQGTPKYERREKRKKGDSTHIPYQMLSRISCVV